MSRRTELMIGGAAISGALLFAGAVLVWRIAFDDAPWSFPAFPRMEGWEAFGIYSWVPWFCLVAAAMAMRFRRDPQRCAAYLAGIVSFATAVIYLPYWFVRKPAVDRLRGAIEEPIPAFRRAVVTAMLTLLLTVVYIAVSRLRRAPLLATYAALATAVVVNAGLLHLFAVPLIEPFEWRPIKADHWSSGLMPVCPRNGNTATFAVSVNGSWRRRYHWLNSSDLHPLRVHKDDPAVVDCDSQPRRERVAPAQWHELGFAW
ncbi:MAG: hypothetical protein ACJ74H_10165 [Thermoanaerobaculia bacterium]